MSQTAATAGEPPVQTPRERAAELNRLLDRYAYQYYALDAPVVSDAAFDALVHELRDLGRAHPELVTPDWYTERVGGYLSNQFASVRHAARMYSIDDVMNLAELDEWLNRVERELGESPAYVCELKIDGLACSCAPRRAATASWART